MSWGGYCGDCGPAQASAWNDGIRARIGPAELHFTRQNELYWRKRRIEAERQTEGVRGSATSG